ncbi:GNAT family N-acetyltransferase [Alicyclobacillus dauci]|uniref:GNAT family N-acetyltransferase n=1 Tax=Alicyclobacillus dauci TaxID=1475485 RepID=A0ABY6ZAW5_9BACL|nr:N-acetyltransferase [Alicyclobacillus dauci]WAH39296.1 GNAT family N-acetyltransferase [Alicyclobacillus dauci]
MCFVEDSPCRNSPRTLHYNQSCETFRRERGTNVHIRRLGAVSSGDDLVGIVTFIRHEHQKLRHKSMLVGMYMTPSSRGQGIGKKLVLEGIRRAQDEWKVEQILLSVVSTNDAALRLYESVGFQTFGVERRALKVGETYLDELHMAVYFNS